MTLDEALREDADLSETELELMTLVDWEAWMLAREEMPNE